MIEPHYIFNAPAELKRLSEMVFVEGSTFMMGSRDDDKDAYIWEKPEHNVAVDSFYIGKYPVTQALWKIVMKETEISDPFFWFKGDNLPAIRVSWEDIQIFLKQLNIQTGRKYRLPTEAEWEYSAKGGQNFKDFPFTFSGSNKLDAVGWYLANSHQEKSLILKDTKSVGLKSPNLLGIHDMSGNIWEWCEDQWHDSYYGAPKFNRAWLAEKFTNRVLRGGAWYSSISTCRCTNRHSEAPYHRADFIGFRLVFVP
jgi:formylglycine-generating enzyme required for sulfatase activity